MRSFGEAAPDKGAPLEELSAKLIEHYDAKRAEQLASDVAAAREKAAAEEWAGAAELFGRVLVQVPNHEVVPEAAKAYLGLAKQHEKDEGWREAEALFSTALSART